MNKAIRFRAAITALFGLIGVVLAVTSVYLFRVDSNHSSINALIWLTLLTLFITVGHMVVLITMIRRKHRKGL
ncbi:hypothetical protein [Paenibacillus dakarensis]|uniref:hypothetical protein n=1 Tax=Paenibacillus dakarensis TaxID=1527293 RepID=UPI0006D56D6E|nr:hypothetical protein [Paenibacillus dakarensis]